MICLVTFRLLMYVGLSKLSAKTSYPRQVKSKGPVARSLQAFVGIAKRGKSVGAGTRTSAPMQDGHVQHASAPSRRCLKPASTPVGQLQEATGSPHTQIYIPEETSCIEDEQDERETSCMKAASFAIGVCEAAPLQVASTPPETRACSTTSIKKATSCDDGSEDGQ